MSALNRARCGAAYTFTVGALDLLSGLALIFVPAQVLALAGVEPEEDWLFVSFVGVYVAAIGLTYLWAAGRWTSRGDAAFLRHVWATSALLRVAVGAFVLAQVALDSFEAAWGAVGLVNLLCAALQIVWLRLGWPGSPAAPAERSGNDTTAAVPSGKSR